MLLAAERNSIGFALALGGLLIIAAVAIWIVAKRTATGELGRNRFAGLRTRPVMASDQAWLAAHQAAQRALQVAAVELGITGILVAVFGRNNDVLVLVLIVGITLTLGAITKATIFANRAAKATSAL